MKKLIALSLAAAFMFTGSLSLNVAKGWGGTLLRNDTLRIGVLEPPVSLNYFSATDSWSRKFLKFLQMPLYIRDPAGKRIPWLAAGPPQVSRDGREVLIRLREAKWDDGSEVTAGDLAFTVRVIREFHVPSHMEKWQAVRKTEVLDPRTIRFVLSGPSPGFFNKALFSSFVQEKEWQEVFHSNRDPMHEADRVTRFEPERVASDGPFYLDKYFPPYFFLLKRNPQFFAANQQMAGMDLGPYVNEISFKSYVTAMEALDALQKGQIDFYWGEVPNELLNSLTEASHITLFTSQRRGYDYLSFNLDRFPFSHKAFRQAVALLVDREMITKEALKSSGVPAPSAIPPYNTEWLNPGIKEPGKGLSRRERVEKSKMLLKKAGFSWAKGGLVLPDGREMKPVGLLTTSAGYKGYRQAVSRLIKKWFSEAGIPVTIRMRPPDTVLTLLRHRSFDMCLMGWGNLSDDPGYLTTFFHSREAGGRGKNYAGYRSEAFDRLADQADEEIQFPKRRAIVFEMQAMIATDMPWLPLYTPNIIQAVRSDRFEGWLNRPGGVGNLWSFLNLRPVM